MIQTNSMLKAADNSGAKKLMCIRVLGGYKKRYARIGDMITCTVKEATPRGMVKKGEIVHAVVARQKKEIRRKNGIYLRFDENAAIVIDKKTKDPKGTRIFGPIARELRGKGYKKIMSLAQEVL